MVAHPQQSSDRVLLSLRLRDDSELRVGLSTYRGIEWVDIRQFWVRGPDDIVATKKGVHFNAELLPEIIAALTKVVE